MNRPTSRDVAVDALAILAVSVAICIAARDIQTMNLVVAAAWLGRLVAWRLTRPRTGREVLVELAFCAFTTGLGAFNDWSSVDRHHVYRYLVPTDLAGLSSLPVWMLVYWGLILRFVATLAMAQTSSADPLPSDVVRFGRQRTDSAVLKVSLELALVFATRQLIYRFSLDPVLSWAPFAIGLALHATLFPWSARERKLVALALTVGPLIEVLYIRVARLHFYELGWALGVPLWIILWWALAVLTWRDLAARILSFFGREAPQN